MPKKKTLTRVTAKKVTRKTRTKKVARAKSAKPRILTFGDEINKFVSHIESLSKAIDPTMSEVLKSYDKSNEAISTFYKKKGVRRTKKDGSESITIKPSDLDQFRRKAKAVSSALLAFTNIPEIFLCSLVHKYDGYLGRLLRVAFTVKPEKLSSSDKSLTYADLAKFSSLSAARESLIEKEIESILRKSHNGHFVWMEDRFELTLRKGLDVWPQFVEITERRNLFAHCDGVISSQYLTVCREHCSELIVDVKVGDQLSVGPQYFSEAFDCMFEIGIKLGHVLWRKLQPDDIEAADDALHTIGYELLVEKRFDLAKKILRFATEYPKIKASSDQIRRLNIINLCIAHKFTGEEQSCSSVLESVDWTACSPKFKLAEAVLKDDFTAAVSIMESIGKDGTIGREEYSNWPLFNAFRYSKDFLVSYHKLFGENFILHKDTDILPEMPTKASRRLS